MPYPDANHGAGILAPTQLGHFGGFYAGANIPYTMVRIWERFMMNIIDIHDIHIVKEFTSKNGVDRMLFPISIIYLYIGGPHSWMP